MSDDYTATQGVFHLLLTTNNGPYEGTGIKLLVDQANNLLGGVPDTFTSYAVSRQNNLMGGYPDSKDFAPLILFAVIFGILGVLHTIVFIINCSRGHYFWPSLAWITHGYMRLIAYALRAQWSTDATKVAIGLVSELFLLIPLIVLVSFNLILAQRLFTWRHPVGGARKLFWSVMILMYIFVLLIIGMTIMASYIPYLHFLSRQQFMKYVKVVEASAILIVLYSVTAACLIALSYWAPTKKDEKRYTYQPWWIESFGVFYFVQPGAAQQAEETFMRRNSNHRHATRVIAATHHHYDSVQGLTTKRGDLKHNVSLFIVMVTTLLILISSIARAVVVFQAHQARNASPIGHPVAMYFFWGVFEVIISVMLLVGRVDLRFYRPDVLPARVRAIITAEQTHYPSDVEDEEEEEEYSYNDAINAHSQHSRLSVPLEHTDSDEWKFVYPDVDDSSTDSQSHRPPYPVEKVKDDNDSEFNF